MEYSSMSSYLNIPYVFVLTPVHLQSVWDAPKAEIHRIETHVYDVV